MTNNYREQIRDIVFKALNEGVNEREIRLYISDTTGLKKTARNDLFNVLKDEWELARATLGVVDQTAEIENSRDMQVRQAIALAIGDRYTYNKESDQYVVWLKAANKNVVIPGSLHRDMLKAYSDWTGDPATINEICRNFSIPRKWFEEYKTIMGWSHDHEPISNEELLSKDENSVVDDLLQQKRFSLHQKFQKKDWEQTQRDAELWRQLKVCQIDPFESFLKTWENKGHNYIAPYTASDSQGDTVLVVGLSDIHAGGLAESKSLYRGEDWNITKYRDAVRRYITQLQVKVANMVNKPSKVVVLGVGDILHGLKGTTEKGTPLVFDRLKDTQFDAAFESLTEFISSMGTLAPSVEVHAVRGNHDGVSGYILFKALEAYFRSETRITFNVPSTETHALRILDTLVLISHGASADYKSKLPKKGSARDSWIQSLLLAKPELLSGIKQKLFICGDLHSFEHEEKNDFEYFRFSTMVAGDAYADGLNLHSRPRQNALLIGPDGVEQVIHCYL